jgi:hypothetical protein
MLKLSFSTFLTFLLNATDGILDKSRAKNNSPSLFKITGPVKDHTTQALQLSCYSRDQGTGMLKQGAFPIRKSGAE